MSLTAKVMANVGSRTKTEWTEVVTTDLLRVVTPNGDEYDLHYEYGSGMKLSGKTDVLQIVPRSSNVIVIRKTSMTEEMERGRY